jgi:hypothetical protein
MGLFMSEAADFDDLIIGACARSPQPNLPQFLANLSCVQNTSVSSSSTRQPTRASTCSASFLPRFRPCAYYSYSLAFLYFFCCYTSSPIAEHRGRNYLFELNKTLSIDGTYVGNDARYINHDAQSPNCRAKGASSSSSLPYVLTTQSQRVCSAHGQRRAPDRDLRE